MTDVTYFTKKPVLPAIMTLRVIIHEPGVEETVDGGIEPPPEVDPRPEPVVLYEAVSISVGSTDRMTSTGLVWGTTVLGVGNTRALDFVRPFPVDHNRIHRIVSVVRNDSHRCGAG